MGRSLQGNSNIITDRIGGHLLKVEKRDGRIVEFDQQRIANAIEKSMRETVTGVDEKLSKSIANKIKNEIEAKNEIVSVELIQDLVEEKLMASSRKDVAKAYILYRNNRNLTRDKSSSEYKLLDDEFISQYKHKPSNMQPLGEFVFYRTYSRYLHEEKRREYWWETVRRAVEYNCSIVPTTKQEAQKLFDNVFNLKQFLSGRTLWVGGTDVVKNNQMANFNCSAEAINEFNDFSELFYLLMLGTGVGVRILKSDVEKLPSVRKDYEIIHKDYTPVSKTERAENTSLIFDNQVVKIVVGDSKNGWVDSLKYYFSIIAEPQYKMIKTIVFDYNNVRPYGEKLKTFGGVASGHTALRDIFIKIDKVIKKTNSNKLKPIDCLDICNIIGEGVVVGGVRRTAEILLFDSDDEECINAKSNLYKKIEEQWIVDQDLVHRSMSNNSIFYQSKPTRERLHWQIEKMRYSGEPSFINQEAGLQRRENFNVCNPCARFWLM